MSKHFAFLEEEKEENESTGKIAWLPVSLGALAVAGFLMLPILGLFRSDNETDWENQLQTDANPVGLQTENSMEPDLSPSNPLLTPNPIDLREDLVSVDETLSSLGENYIPPASKTKTKRKIQRGVNIKGSSVVKAPSSANRPIKKQIKTVATVTQARRLPVVQKPRVSAVAAQSAAAPRSVVVQQGDTLYGIAKRNHSTPGEIARINGTNQKDPIKVGQVLKVPGNQSAPPKRITIVTMAKSPPKILTPNEPVTARPQIVLPRKAPRNVAVPAAPVYQTTSQPNPIIVAPTRAPQTTPTVVNPYPNIGPVVVTPTRTPQTAPTVATPRPNTVPVLVTPTRTQQSIPTAATPSPNSAPIVVAPVITQPVIATPPPGNPLDKYNHAIAYRVQGFDSIKRIADAHATTPESLIELNGRNSVKKGEMLVVPVDNCLIKNGQ